MLMPKSSRGEFAPWIEFSVELGRFSVEPNMSHHIKMSTKEVFDAVRQFAPEYALLCDKKHYHIYHHLVRDQYSPKRKTPMHALSSSPFSPSLTSHIPV